MTTEKKAERRPRSGTANLQTTSSGLNPVTEARIIREIKAAFKAFCVTPLPGDDLDALKRSLESKMDFFLGGYESVVVTFDPTVEEVLLGLVRGSIKVQQGRSRVVANFKLHL